MHLFSKVVLCAVCFHTVSTVKVKVVMHSEEDSRVEEEDTAHTETWDHKKRTEPALLPFIKRATKQTNDKLAEFEESFTTEKSLSQIHPNEMIFPLIYKQKNINSMFKYGEVWYTWAVEKRTDGSTAVNYYTCNDEPKRCDDIGWDGVDALPKCAFQIEALMPEDRACINIFGVEPRSTGACDGAELMKVSEIVHSCGPRIRSFWRFNRVGRRPANVPKPADVNSLFCEDEEECFLTIEYRIHHDRITFSLHEPQRGQTFKSALKREGALDDDKRAVVTEVKAQPRNRSPKLRKDNATHKKLMHAKSRASRTQETKGVVKENNESGYIRRHNKNAIKNRDLSSDDTSE